MKYNVVVEPAVNNPRSVCSLTAPPDIVHTASVRTINSCFTSRSDGRHSGCKVTITKKDLMSVLTGQWLCDNVSFSFMHLSWLYITITCLYSVHSQIVWSTISHGSEIFTLRLSFWMIHFVCLSYVR